MNQNTIDFMYELRDLLKKRGAHIEIISNSYLAIHFSDYRETIEVSDQLDHDEIQQWLALTR